MLGTPPYAPMAARMRPKNLTPTGAGVTAERGSQQTPSSKEGKRLTVDRKADEAEQLSGQEEAEASLEAIRIDSSDNDILQSTSNGSMEASETLAEHLRCRRPCKRARSGAVLEDGSTSQSCL